MDELHNILQMILQQGYLMSLATTDEGGVWVSDVIYVFDDKYNLYWLSRENVRHSQAVLINPIVAATITVTNSANQPDMGLQISGRVEKVEGDIFEMAKKHREKRGKPSPEKDGEILEPGESWYKLTPTKIEVIYSPKWGFKKQTVEL